MQALSDYMKSTMKRLNRDVTDLDSLRFVMRVLKFASASPVLIWKSTCHGHVPDARVFAGGPFWMLWITRTSMPQNFVPFIAYFCKKKFIQESLTHDLYPASCVLC